MFIDFTDDKLKQEILDSFKGDTKTDDSSSNISMIRINLQFSSNMRMLIGLKGQEENTRFQIGAPK